MCIRLLCWITSAVAAGSNSKKRDALSSTGAALAALLCSATSLYAADPTDSSSVSGSSLRAISTSELDDSLEMRKSRFQQGYGTPRSLRRIDLHGSNVQKLLVRARLELASGDTYAAHKYVESAAKSGIPYELFKHKPYAFISEIENAAAQGRDPQFDRLTRPAPLPTQEFLPVPVPGVLPESEDAPTAPVAPPAPLPGQEEEPPEVSALVEEQPLPEIPVDITPQRVAPLLPQPQFAVQPPAPGNPEDMTVDKSAVAQKLRRGYRAINPTSLSILPPAMDKDGNQQQQPEPQARKRLEQVPVENHTLGMSRTWNQNVFGWEAPAFYYSPLYFEDEQLERYGNELPVVQPVVSGAKFLLTIPTLPYQMGTEGNGVCAEIYDLRCERPGDCVPYSWERLPFSWTGAITQGVATTGLVFIIP